MARRSRLCVAPRACLRAHGFKRSPVREAGGKRQRREAPRSQRFRASRIRAGTDLEYMLSRAWTSVQQVTPPPRFTLVRPGAEFFLPIRYIPRL